MGGSMANKNKKQASTLGKNDVYFNCNGCGKCCTGELTIFNSEYFKYSDKFMYIQELHYYIIGYVNDNQLDIYAKSNPDNFYAKIHNLTVAFRLGLSAKSFSDWCVNLVNNACIIYKDRPISCLTTPFYQKGAERLNFVNYKSDLLKINDKLLINNCVSFLPRNDFRQIIKNGNLIDTNILNNVITENQFISDDRDMNFAIIDHYLNINKNEIDNVVNDFISKPHLTSNAGFFWLNSNMAQFFYLNNELSLDDYEIATTNQYNLYNNALNRVTTKPKHIAYINAQIKMLQICLDDIKNIRANN